MVGDARCPFVEKGVDSRSSANRSGDKVGSWDADKPPHGFCDRLDVAQALLAVWRDDVFHDDVSDCGVASADRPGVIDARRAHGGRWLGIEGLGDPILGQCLGFRDGRAILDPCDDRPTGRLAEGDSTEMISFLSAHGLDFIARREIGVREKTGVGCRHGS